jgi:hypothetical protein
MRSHNRQLFLLCLSSAALVLAGPATAAAPTPASPPAEAVLQYRDEQIVTYRAWLQEGHLVVQVQHQEPWHTYAMDNVERARERSGKQRPDTELPTVIALQGDLRATGGWLQTAPRELSQPELHWYTWGFEGISYFAVPISEPDAFEAGEAKITINGQACTAERCAMIDDLEFVLGTEAPPPNDLVLEIHELIPLAGP